MASVKCASERPDSPLLNSTVRDNIHDVTDLVLAEVGGQRDHSSLLEVSAERIALEKNINQGSRI